MITVACDYEPNTDELVYVSVNGQALRWSVDHVALMMRESSGQGFSIPYPFGCERDEEPLNGRNVS